jgi:hypothetical protein
MNALNSAFGSIDVQSSIAQIDLRPTKLAEFLGTQAMTICKEDRCTVSCAIAPTLTRCLD